MHGVSELLRVTPSDAIIFGGRFRGTPGPDVPYLTSKLQRRSRGFTREEGASYEQGNGFDVTNTACKERKGA